MPDNRSPGTLGNRREHRRYPAWIETALTNPEARTSAPATVLDISLGGASLQTHQLVEEGGEVALTINSPLGALSLQGRVVRDEPSWTGSILHIEFLDPGPVGRLTLCRLLDELEQDYRRHQQEFSSHRT
jgi:hypothetical protein